MSNHKAVVAKLTDVRKHPNADRLQLATVLGATVIVGISNKEGEVGLFFNSDLQLSEEFVKNNNLYSSPEKNLDPTKKGYFGNTRKVRAQSFRGVKSDGFWCEVYFLDFINLANCKDPDETCDLNEGDEIDTYFGVPVCNKFVTPETQRAIANAARNKVRKQFPSFPKHVDTEHFFKESRYIPIGSHLYFTEKVHGTSGRFGYVEVEEEYNSWWRKLLGIKSKIVTEYSYEIGTRNVVLGKPNSKSFYGSEAFRDKIVENLKGKLHRGEVLYYEIVGYTCSGQPIMPPGDLRKIGDKEIIKTYGEINRWNYGCEVNHSQKPQTDMYVYRIIRTDKDGNAIEYSWPQVKRRCQELGIKYVPEYNATQGMILEPGDVAIEGIEFGVTQLMDGPSLIDNTHIREGVIVRVESPDGKTYFLKAKSTNFKILEDIIKQDETYVDTEEAS